jgi:hypothetical protein
MEFLLHEVTEITLADRGTGQAGKLDRSFHLIAIGVEEAGTLAIDDDPVTINQVSDTAGKGSQGKGIRAYEHLVFPEADGKRAGKDNGQGVSAFQPFQSRAGSLDRLHTMFQIVVDQLGDGFRVGFGAELLPRGFEFGAQFGVIFDDTAVDQRSS